jgi:hypothetical protein
MARGNAKRGLSDKGAGMFDGHLADTGLIDVLVRAFVPFVVLPMVLMVLLLAIDRLWGRDR